MKIGLIGVGARGATLAKNILDSGLAEITAAFDISADHARHYMKLLGVELPLVPGKEAILGDKHIDAVVVATPDHCHAADACDAMRAGKPVFCEKPMAIGIEDCDQMLRVQRETGVPLRIGFNLRFHPMYRAMHEIAASGELGRLRAVWVRHGPCASSIPWKAATAAPIRLWLSIG